ncbi:Aste57867_8632 [Aphanomyces stellatus]|uniref:Aste57867_8632 protein n=1 Tax=Aphanomyces stellatus TaxID=120398 RepID=A0A485KKS3_9STRA|nr:hypothetical protein As57867_008598 [Aphanomyces stellatus]VFT85518.1 Aste57867_8632 [Aphanomyces stellatus]
MADDEIELDVALMERFDRKLRRRTYERHFKRRCRQGEKNERAVLLTRVVELQRILDPLLERSREAKGETATMLSWEEVAGALKDESKFAASQFSALKAQVAAYAALARSMEAWVTACVLQEGTLDLRACTWQDTSLPAAPNARQLGKKWIASRMYHNMDRIFQEHDFPAPLDSSKEILDEFSTVFNDVGFTHIFRLHSESARPLEKWAAFIRHTIVSFHCCIPGYSPTLPCVVREEDEHMRQYGVVTPLNEYANVLIGEFHKPGDRVVFVVQQILDDESCRANPQHIQRRRRIWIEVRELPNGRRRVRMLSLHSNGFKIAGEDLTLDQDAWTYGIDLHDCPSHLKESRYVRMIRERIDQAAESMERYLLT